MKDSTYISVILPVRLNWLPCYSCGQENTSVETGQRVRVLFGGKQYIGVVCATGIVPDTETEKIKSIITVETGLERISNEELRLWKELADYYMCTIGEVYKAAYPSMKISDEKTAVKLKQREEERERKKQEAIRKKTESLMLRIQVKKALAEKCRKEERKSKLKEEISLLEQRLYAVGQDMNNGGTSDVTDMQGYSGIVLTSSQQKALQEIKNAFSARKTALLHGVTGAGKTEIFLSLAEEVMGKGMNVLYMVPEIALSRQLEDRLKLIFGERLMTFHSAESISGKRETTETIRAEGGHIVLGTRSSVFLPFRKLGLVIVDEEHDSSYKQDSPAPRYNGRDAAVILAGIHGCNIVLGSATPSLESIYNCSRNKYSYVWLAEKYYEAEEPDVEIIDTVAERKKRGMTGSFSRKLIMRIRETLDNGGQIVILRSRRSYSPVLQCSSCGDIPKCPHCNVGLCLHNDGKGGRMICHYCGYSTEYTGKCGKCGGCLAGLGAGTQKIEEEAKSLFPEARIERLDSDTAQNKTYEKETIRKFENKETDILIGTQMLSKGFDFQGLNLVVVMQADSLLGQQDFRADEKAVQILTQFRGRCGRRHEKGRFIIQTAQPEHPVYGIVTGKAISGIPSILDERQEYGYPPFTRMINISVRDRYEDRAERMSRKLADILEKNFNGTDAQVIGPYTPAVGKIADNHIRNLRLLLKKDKSLTAKKEMLGKIIAGFEAAGKYDNHIIIDVDPS